MAESPTIKRNTLLRRAGDSTFGLMGLLNTRERQLPKVTREFKEEKTEHHACSCHSYLDLIM